MWKTIVNSKRILSEAPEGSEDFQLSNDDLGYDAQDFNTTEIPGAKPESGQTAQPGQTGEEGQGDEMGGQPTDAGVEEDPMGGGMPQGIEEPSLPGETETDKIKKLVLFEQYKKLIEICEQSKFALSYLVKLNDFKDDELLSYLKDSIDNLNDKITDVISYHFLTTDYVELLRKFYYLKYNLKSITKAMEKFSDKYKANQQNK